MLVQLTLISSSMLQLKINTCSCTAGSGLGMKNWLRITFAVDPGLLEDGLQRVESFCKRHEKAKEVK